MAHLNFNKSADWAEFQNKILKMVDDFTPLYSDVNKMQPPNAEGWTQGLCPFHQDKNPSFGFNTKTGKWKCFAGCGTGSYFDYQMQRNGTVFKEELVRLAEEVGMELPKSKPERPPIDRVIIEKFHQALLANKDGLRYLHDERGLSLGTIEKFKIGWDKKRQRYSIPIWDENGEAVNIRLYNTKNKAKVISYTDDRHKYGSPYRLYGVNELLKSDAKQIIICEGELDRLKLREEGFRAVTSTGGAASFRPEWAKYFKGKRVVIIFDKDQAGTQAVQRQVLPALKNADAKWIKVVELPLKGSKSEKDITDYFVKLGNSASDLKALIKSTDKHKFAEEAPEKTDEEIIEVKSFTEIDNKELVDKKISVPINISGETNGSYHAVEEFKIDFCSGEGQGNCVDCIGFSQPHRIPPHREEYIASCFTTKNYLIGMIRNYACKFWAKPTIDIVKRTTVIEFFCQQVVKRVSQIRDADGNIIDLFDGKKQELIEKRVYYLSSTHPKPGHYQAVGWVKTHPKTQEVTFLIENLTPLEIDYESFDLHASLPMLEQLQGLSRKEKLKDLTDNVTQIYGRNEVLLSILLTWLSPRFITFNRENIRGWILMALVGDSGSGKTQTYTRLSEFLGVGDTFSGLTGSRTGLCYALVETKAKGWQIKIGRYPANNRKILLVDEAQNLEDFDLKSLAKSMDEGFLQIDRVQSRGYECQTRLLLVANPKFDRTMDTFSFGIETLKTLYSPMFIRRLDMVVLVNSSDLKNLNFVNQASPTHRNPKITPDMLRALVYWSWNLKSTEISFSKQATEKVLRLAKRMSDKYGDAISIPLVNQADIRKKLARISAAFAVFNVSANNDFTKLRIKKKHVVSAYKFLDKVYSHENCALDDYSEIEQHHTHLPDYETIKKQVLKKIDAEKHGSEHVFRKILFALYVNDKIKRDDLAEQVDCDKDTVSKHVKVFKKNHMLESSKGGYVKKPKFNKFLRLFKQEYPELFDLDQLAS